MHVLSLLRPQTIGQILDRTVRLYRRNFWTFLGIVAIVQIPIMALSLLNVVSTFGGIFAMLQNPLAAPEVTLGNSVVMQLVSSLVSLASIFLTQFSTAALCLAVVHALFDKPISLTEAYRKMWNRWQSLSGMAVLLAVVAIMLSIAMLFGFLLILPGIMMLGIIMFFSLVVTPLVVPVLMLEDAGAWEAIQRAWNLARRRLWPLVGLMTVNLLFVGAMVAGVQIVIFTIFGVVVADSMTSGDIVESGFLSATAMTVAFSALASTFIAPIQQGLATLAYVDLRVRNEGLDLALATAELDASPLELLVVAPKQRNERDLLMRSEFGRFLGLGFIPFGLILLYVAVVFLVTFAIAGLAGF